MTREPADVEPFVRRMGELDRVLYLGQRGWTWRWHQGRRYWGHPSRPGRLSTMAIAIRDAVAEEMGVQWPPQPVGPPLLRVVGTGSRGTTDGA